jgi:hypothetical protein
VADTAKQLQDPAKCGMKNLFDFCVDKTVTLTDKEKKGGSSRVARW